MRPLARFIGHRGVAGLAPENTIASVRLAAARGFRWIEVDARTTKDGVAVLSHDDSLWRCGGDRRRLSRLAAATATSIRVANGMETTGETNVPLLTDVMRLAAALSLGVVVEIKASRRDAEKSATAVFAVLRDCAAPHVVSSFRADVLRHARRLSPGAALAWNMSSPAQDWRGIRRELGAANMHVNGRYFAAADLQEIKAAGLGVYCFTVNDPRRQRQLLAQGADGVFVDFPPPAATAGGFGAGEE